jgi:hypothetical protein
MAYLNVEKRISVISIGGVMKAQYQRNEKRGENSWRRNVECVANGEMKSIEAVLKSGTRHKRKRIGGERRKWHR